MKQEIFDILKSLEIPFDNYEHDAVFTCDEAKWVEVPGRRVKSLLLRNKKSANFYMVVLPDDKRLDTNVIKEEFWDTKISFASTEAMVEKIWVKPWSVSPFALINNEEKDIKVVFDNFLQGSLVWFHPLQNNNTVVLNIKDMLKFLENLWIYYMFKQM